MRTLQRNNLNSSDYVYYHFRIIIQFYAFCVENSISLNLFWICCVYILGNKYVQEVFENVYKVVMKLTIVDVDIEDFGAYKCVAKNSLGETDGSIKLYRKYPPLSIMHIFFLII